MAQESYFHLKDAPGPDLSLTEEGRPQTSSRPLLRSAGTTVLLTIAAVAVICTAFFSSMGPFVQMDKKLPHWELEECHPTSVPVPRVEDMTLDEKIGQMTQVDQLSLCNSSNTNSWDDITKYHIGSVLSGGGGAPVWGNKPVDWANLIDHVQAKALKTRLRIPMVYGIDAVHGNNNVWGATMFPHHVGLGAARNPGLVQKIGAAAARETAATGIRWAFSPAVSVCRDPRWGRCYESFSEHPKVVQSMTSEISGWQTPPTDSSDPASKVPGNVFVAATAKHFVGDGGTHGGVDQGNTMISEADLRRIHLPPYYDAIARGVQTIMISYSSWNGLKMHGNKNLLTDVLKEEMGFEGVLISDWQAINQLPGTWADQIRTSINAGLDMIMVPDIYQSFIATLREEVLSGRVPESRIDDAVRRILKMKENLGLFENGCAIRELLPEIGAPKHRAIARQAVHESMVLLKNERRGTSGSANARSMFPLRVDGAKILVAGSHADNIGLQSGGWTIEWQGASGNITPGTTILEGIKEVTAGRATVEHVEHPTGNETADYAILVVGEKPYTEGMGDDQHLQLNPKAQELIKTVSQKMPCVVVLISGRALQIAHLLPQVDAFVAAWLPGTEGNGIADGLFGGGDFTGRLPVTWFREAVNLPMTIDNELYTPLFPLGFGLTKGGSQLPAL